MQQEHTGWGGFWEQGHDKGGGAYALQPLVLRSCQMARQKSQATCVPAAAKYKSLEGEMAEVQPL